MIKIILTAILLCTAPILFAQAYDAQVDYNRKKQAAVAIEYNFPEDAAEKAITDKLERSGLRIKRSKGYIVAENSIISAIDGESLDYAFKVERKSRKEKAASVIYLIINKSDLNITNDKSSNAKAFLTSLMPDIDGVNTDNLITAQTNTVAKAEKRLKNLEDDQRDMEKRIQRLQDDIKKSIKDQADQKTEIQRQQEILIGLKTKKTT